MNHFIKISLLLFAGLQLISCYKDKGNYSYSDINQPASWGLDTAYTFYQGDRLKITPKLVWTQDASYDTSRYTYSWESITNINSAGRMDLSYSRNLDTTSILAPSDYYVYYKVMDKKTGVKWQNRFIMHVKTTTYEGWMLLTDLGGTSRLDMLSKITSGWNKIIDVFKFTNSNYPDALNGAPKFVRCWYAKPNSSANFPAYGITVSTANGTTRVDPETFAWKPIFTIGSEFLTNIPSGFYATSLVSPVKNSAVIQGNDDNVYTYYNAWSVFYGLPVNILSAAPYNETKPFRTSPYIAQNPNDIGYDAFCMFDKDKRRFLMTDMISSSSRPLQTIPGAYFDFNNVQKDLVWMAYAKNPSPSGNIYAILKDTAAANYYFTYFNFAAFPAVTVNQQMFQQISLSAATDIDKATNFCVSPVYEYTFYSVGGKVYSYNYVSNKSLLMLDFGSKTVSLMQFDSNNNLQVFASDAGAPATSGIFDTYTVMPVQGPLQLVEHIDGLGRVVSASYRKRP
jgi:hypothetical protein